MSNAIATGPTVGHLSGDISLPGISFAVAEQPKVARHRNESIDVVRFFAAAGIVFLHCIDTSALSTWNELCRFAVPFYLFASLYYQSLSLRRNTDRTFSQQVTARFKRLYIPFLAWDLIYLGMRDVRRMSHDNLPLTLQPNLLWQGSEYHLWFLPFLLAASIVLAIVHWGILKRDPRWRWPLIIIAIAVGVVFSVLPVPANWNDLFTLPTHFYVQAWRAMPAVCWGMAFAWYMTMGPKVYGVSRTLGAAGIALALVYLFKQVAFGIQAGARGLTGLGCVLAGLAPWHGHAMSAMARLGRLGYGIYLCHVLFVETFHEFFIYRLHFAPSAWLDIVNFAFSFCGSLALVRLFARSPRLSWLNG
jgi:peptidoglycan/LPS O-acetylase OafA/YrhL